MVFTNNGIYVELMGQENLLHLRLTVPCFSDCFCSDVEMDELGRNSLKLVDRPAVSTRSRPPSSHTGFLKNYGGASSLQRSSWSAATVRVLSSMPSRTAGETNLLIVDTNVNNLLQHGIQSVVTNVARKGLTLAFYMW